MRLKSIQDPPSIAKSLICALVTVLVMSMVMVEATPYGVVHMEPHEESRSLKRLSTNITSEYTNKTRERRLTNLLNDGFIATFASKLGTDLSQVEEEIPALEKYERFVEVTRNFYSFLKGNDFKESSSKEIIDILLHYIDGDVAVVSSLKTLDEKKAESLLYTLFREWKDQEVTLEAAFEILRLGKNVNDFLDSKLINMWEKFGIGYTNQVSASPLRPMLQVLSNQFGVPDLVKALVVRNTADLKLMGGRLYRLQLRVWRTDGQLSPRTFYEDFELQSWDSLCLSIWMDFVLVREHVHFPNSGLYRKEVLGWLTFMEIPIEQLMTKELEIKKLMDDWLMNKKSLNKGLLKKELMVKELMDTKLWITELINKEVMNKELINKKELMDKELLNKGSSKKEVIFKWLRGIKLMMKGSINKKMINKELISKKKLKNEESMIQELNKEVSTEELMNAELIIKELRDTESVIKDLLDKELMNRELMMKPLMTKSLKNKLEDMELMNKELMVKKGLMEKKLMEKKLIEKKLMDMESIKKEPLNTELMNKEMMHKELMIQELKIREIANWQMLLEGTRWSDEALNARCEELLHY